MTMKIRLLFLGLLLLTTWVAAATFEEFMAQGDTAFDIYDNEAALTAYQSAFALNSNDCDAAWKVSRAYADIGDDKTVKEERIENFNKAEEFARKAIAICPNSDMAHLQLSIAIGRVALMAGKKEQVQLSQAVKDEAEKALELNPNNDTAHHVYARWHRKVATLSGIQKAFAKILYGGLPPASLEDAEKHFLKAIELNPEHINHHLELGLTYLEMKQNDKAEASFRKALELPAKNSKDKEYQAEAAEQLKKLTGK
jgi:tetratricopeptide (TPR) repeat protein